MIANGMWEKTLVPLSAALRMTARFRPQATALVTVDSLGDMRYDYAEVDRRAACIAAHLVSTQGGSNGRALLLMESGVDYVSAFYGCLYAGVIAVPVYPPESKREQHIARLAGIARDAQVSFLLTTSALHERFSQEYRRLAPQAEIVLVDELCAAPCGQECFAPLAVAPNEIAFLQYTSGSTGAPKGVMVSHGNLVENQLVLAAAWGVSSDDVYVSWLPLYHDMGLIGAMMQALFSGMALVLMSPQFFLERPIRWLRAIERYHGTITGAPDFAYRLCADHIKPRTAAGLDLSSLRVAYSGSEPVRRSTLDAFATRFEATGLDARALFPCYGLAEATLYVSGGQRGGGFMSSTFRGEALAAGRVELAGADEPGVVLVACGAPQAGHDIRIVDTLTGGPAEINMLGEIEVSGPSVTRGYWRQPDASAEVLHDMESPADASGSNRWLRTGDLGFVHGGQLYIASRRKDLIIVRGRNLYPQDIEQLVENACDFVRKGRVVAFDAEVGDQEGPGLAVEIPPMVKGRVSAAGIVEQLSRSVFDACGEPPAAIVLLNPGALPKTSSGKVQRAATRRGWRERTLDAYVIWERGRFVHGDAEKLAADGNDQAATLNGQIEQELARLWHKVLGSRPAARDTHFFVAGGSSLTAARLAALVGDQWMRPVDIGLIFEFPAFADLALAIARLARAPACPQEPDGDALTLQRSSENVVSHAQQRQIFTAKLDPDSTAYHIAIGIRLRGELDDRALYASFDELVERHAVLRTTFVEQGDRYVPNVSPLEPLERVRTVLPGEIESGQGAVAEHAIQSLARQFVAKPFDLANGPLLRVGVLQVSKDDHLLLIALHHIAADGWSIHILIDEWVARYRSIVTGTRQSLAVSEGLTYRDYAAWQRHWLRGKEATRQLEYWRSTLADMAPAMALPFERSGAGLAGNLEADRVDFSLSGQECHRIRGAASRCGTTPFVLMLAAWHACLYRMTGEVNVRTGVPVANRRHQEVQGIVGFFVNTLVIRSVCSPSMTVSSLLATLRRTVLNGLAHQELPFDVLVEELNPERGAGRMPLFETMFNYLLDDYPSLGQIPGISASRYEIVERHAKVRLSIDLRESGDGALRGFLTYARDGFEAPAVQRIVAQYLRVTEALVTALLDTARGRDTTLSDLTLLDAEETRRIHHESRGAVRPLPGEPVHRHFERHARARPERLAVVDGPVQLTYAQLDRRAQQIANWLLERGLTAEQRVAIIADRSSAFIAAMLGVLKAGGTYVPLDATTPQARLEQALADCGPAFVLTEHTDAALSRPDARQAVIADVAERDMEPACDGPAVDMGQAAYVIYTSGSTGVPKGVVVPHGALSNYVASVIDKFNLTSDVAFAMVSTVAADLGHTVLFGALAGGGTLHLIDRDMALDADRFAEYMSARHIDVLKIVPSHLSALLDAQRAADVLPAAALVLGGEATTWALVQRIHALKPACRVINHYGPTETTVGVLVQDVAHASREAATLPLGLPLDNQHTWVLDGQMQLTGVGQPGELYLGGAGVSRGYLGCPGLTAERFVPDPFESGARLYRSGDRARRLDDGTIEYLGRVDDQLKIRGYRVEPAEVAAQLRALDGVREAAVVVTQERRLAAFVTAQPGHAPDTRALRKQLARTMPDYMLPSTLQLLDALPLNRNGKIDRQVLVSLARVAGKGRVARGNRPQSQTEIGLAVIWSDVLGWPPGETFTDIERDDNFFAIGGHSLAAMRIPSRVRIAWSVDLPLREVFAAPTLEALAATIDELVVRGVRGAEPSPVDLTIPSANRQARLPLSLLQQRIWVVDQLAGGQLASYNMVVGLAFHGALEVGLLEASIGSLINRHEVLRSAFPADDDGVPMTTLAASVSVSMPLIDGGLLDPGEREQALARLLADAVYESFDLAEPPLLRTVLVRFGPRDHVLIVALHHIVADGESIHVFMRELMETYRGLREGRAPALPDLPIQYVDYAAWQRREMSPARLREEQAFWRAYLDGVPHFLPLPTSCDRPAIASHEGDAARFMLSAQTGARVRALAAQQRVTPFSVLLASFQWFLHILTGEHDIVIGTDVADRSRPELEGLIGFFINVLPVRSRIPDPDAGPPSFNAWLAASRRSVLEALEHRAAPFDRIVEALKVARRRDANPLVQVLFVLRDLPRGNSCVPGLTVDLVRPPTLQSKFDMALFVEPRDAGYEIEWVFTLPLFGKSTMEQWFQQWSFLLENILARPAEALQLGLGTGHMASSQAMSGVVLMQVEER